MPNFCFPWSFLQEVHLRAIQRPGIFRYSTKSINVPNHWHLLWWGYFYPRIFNWSTKLLLHNMLVLQTENLLYFCLIFLFFFPPFFFVFLFLLLLIEKKSLLLDKITLGFFNCARNIENRNILVYKMKNQNLPPVLDPLSLEAIICCLSFPLRDLLHILVFM